MTYEILTIVNCSAETESFDYQKLSWFKAFYIIANCVQIFLMFMGCILNCISFRALGIENSNSELAIQLRSLSFCDSIFLVLTTMDNACHTLEAVPLKDVLPFYIFVYLHPPIWGLRVMISSIHNWTMLFLALSRCARVLWPLKCARFFSKDRVLIIILGIWISGAATGLVRGLEVIGVILTDCADNLTRMDLKTSGLFPAYTAICNFGFQTLIPVIIAIITNIILVKELKLQNNKRKHLQKHNCAATHGTKPIRMTRMVFMLSGLYIVCQIPTVAYGILTVQTAPITSIVYTPVMLAANMFTSLDASCNFFIYVATNKKFKNSIKHILGRTKSQVEESKTKLYAVTASGIAVSSSNELQARIVEKNGTN